MNKQIIIDGVDVNECKFLVSRFSNNTDYCCSELNNTFLKCPKRNCYFKQLARKTQELYLANNEISSKTEYIQEQRDEIKQLEQECEKLKKYIQEREVWGDQCEFCKHNDKENCHQNIILDNLRTINRYRNILEEIKEYCDNQISLIGGLPFKTTESDILNIINKVKDGE